MNKKIFIILLVSFYIPAAVVVVTAFLKIREMEKNIVKIEKNFAEIEKQQSTSVSDKADNNKGSETLNILMTFAKIREQMDSLSKEIEELKKLKTKGKKEDGTYEKVSKHQQDLWRRFSASYRSFYTKGKKQVLEQHGFYDYEQDLIMENFQMTMKDIENAQILWMNGEIDMEELMLRIQDSGRKLKNYLTGDLGEEKARKALRIMIDNPVYQQLLFPPGANNN